MNKDGLEHQINITNYNIFVKLPFNRNGFKLPAYFLYVDMHCIDEKKLPVKSWWSPKLLTQPRW